MSFNIVIMAATTTLNSKISDASGNQIATSSSSATGTGSGSTESEAAKNAKNASENAAVQANNQAQSNSVTGGGNTWNDFVTNSNLQTTTHKISPLS